MKEIKDQNSKDHGKSERHQLLWNIIFLIAAIIYTISPMDIIPDVLGPLGFTDDLFLWIVIVGMGLYQRSRKKPKAEEQTKDKKGKP
jgi:uncharacterized membrane protein YkvA (DUF1232 family)